jgi:hypothetical protein
MKTLQNFLASLIVLFSITNTTAQFGNGYNSGRGNGMNQMGDMNQRSEPEKPKEIPAEEIVAKYMKEMKPAIELDELQTVAITNVLIETVKYQGRISKLNLPQDNQIKEYNLLTENTDKKINDFLNKIQKNKYLTFKEDMKNQKKHKTKEKKK